MHNEVLRYNPPPKPTDLLAHFASSFASLLASTTASPMNNITIVAEEDATVNPDALGLIRLLMRAAMDLLRGQYEKFSTCRPASGQFEAKFYFRSAVNMVSEMMQPSAILPVNLLRLFNQAKYVPVQDEKFNWREYEHLHFEEFLVLVAQLLALFANIDIKVRTNLPKFISSDRNTIDKLIKEEKKDEKKGFELKLQTILQHCIGDRTGSVFKYSLA